jgi:conjugal transfer pilus assembly protein TraF
MKDLFTAGVLWAAMLLSLVAVPDCVFGQTAARPPAQTMTAMLARQLDTAEVEPSYFKRSREGWFWYEDPLAVVALPPSPSTQAARPAAEPVQSSQDKDLAAFKAFQVTFERSMQAATQNPSEANVAKFLELYALARRKASMFGDAAQSLAVRMPWIDETFSGSRPSGSGAMRAFDSIRMQDNDQLMRELAQTHGLYFFFRNNCAYCHVQAPFLRQFEKKYGFTVFAVSMDGSSLAAYPNAVRDNGLAAQVAASMGVPMQHFATPAIVLARPSTREVVPVGFGVMNVDEMVDRVAMVVRVRDQGAGEASPNQVSALTGQPPTQAVQNTTTRGQRTAP